MDSLLKNFGLSDTRFQLKFQTPKGKLKKTYQQKSFNKYTRTQAKKNPEPYLQETNLLTNFNKSKKSQNKQQKFLTQKKLSKNQIAFIDKQEKHSTYQKRKNQKQTLTIERITNLLQKSKNQKCFKKGHQYNFKKFVCLQQNCQEKIGCSYCFLHQHRGHMKSQVSVCTKDLNELKLKIIQNNQKMNKKALQFRDQFLKQISKQINFIKAEFQVNIQFLQKKVTQFVQSFVNQKYGSFLSDQELYKNINQNSLQQKKFNDVTDISIDTTKNNLRKQFYQNIFSQQQKDKKLLHQLSVLDFQEVQSYLDERLKQIDQQKNQTRVFLQYFQEMNSSISIFFSAFKKNIPKLYFDIFQIKPPTILN